MPPYHLVWCANDKCFGPTSTATNLNDASIQWNTRAAQTINDDALWALASTLHSNVEEDARPMSWSDFSPEQIQRLRQAAIAFLAALRAEPQPVGNPLGALSRETVAADFARQFPAVLAQYSQFKIVDWFLSLPAEGGAREATIEEYANLANQAEGCFSFFAAWRTTFNNTNNETTHSEELPTGWFILTAMVPK